MPHPRKKHVARTIALEVCHSELDLVMVEHDRDGQTHRVRTLTVPWRQEAQSLHTESGQRELTAALKTVVAKEKLNGAKVYIALNGDFCVTRVVAGSADHVRHELRQLEERSALYLSLGTGEKALAANVRQIDVRHQHAWLTVTNKKTLDALLAATEAAGLSVELMEPSLVALCRVVGRMGHDNDAPALIIAVDERGVELGITYQGRLLLDYRPGGRRAKEDIAGIVLHHLDRLQRYCDRHFRHAAGTISQVFLCGEPDSVEEVRETIARAGTLAVEVLDPRTCNSDWSFEDGGVSTKMVAAVGTALAAGLSSVDRNGPNLMDRTRTGMRDPLLRGLWRSAWPVAASLLLAAGIFLGATFEKVRCTELEATLDGYAVAKQRFEDLQGTLASTKTKLTQLHRVARELKRPEWHRLMATIGHCLPDGVWLEKIRVDSQGRLSLTGASYVDESVFEFVGWLKKSPQFDQVALEGTQLVRLPTGPSTRFDVTCVLADLRDHKERGNQDD